MKREKRFWIGIIIVALIALIIGSTIYLYGEYLLDKEKGIYFRGNVIYLGDVENDFVDVDLEFYSIRGAEIPFKDKNKYQCYLSSDTEKLKVNKYEIKQIKSSPYCKTYQLYLEVVAKADSCNDISYIIFENQEEKKQLKYAIGDIRIENKQSENADKNPFIEWKVSSRSKKVGEYEITFKNSGKEDMYIKELRFGNRRIYDIAGNINNVVKAGKSEKMKITYKVKDNSHNIVSIKPIVEYYYENSKDTVFTDAVSFCTSFSEEIGEGELYEYLTR